MTNHQILKHLLSMDSDTNFPKVSDIIAMGLAKSQYNCVLDALDLFRHLPDGHFPQLKLVIGETDPLIVPLTDLGKIEQLIKAEVKAVDDDLQKLIAVEGE